jgi:hypothetical protein
MAQKTIFILFDGKMGHCVTKMADESPIRRPVGLLPEFVLGFVLRFDSPFVPGACTGAGAYSRPIEPITACQSTGSESAKPARDWKIGGGQKGGSS